jgi:hypothetical protein
MPDMLFSWPALFCPCKYGVFGRFNMQFNFPKLLLDDQFSTSKSYFESLCILSDKSSAWSYWRCLRQFTECFFWLYVQLTKLHCCVVIGLQ